MANTQRAMRKKYILMVEISTAISPVAAISSALSANPTCHSVAMPQKACRQAPADQMPIDQRKPRFVPSQSTTRPAKSMPIA